MSFSACWNRVVFVEPVQERVDASADAFVRSRPESGTSDRWITASANASAYACTMSPMDAACSFSDLVLADGFLDNRHDSSTVNGPGGL